MKNPGPERESADWIAWAFQLIGGLIVGGLVGGYIVIRLHIPMLYELPMLLPFVSGCALVCGGMATRYGDKLWIGDSYRCIPPDEVKHSSASKRASSGLIIAGLIVTAVPAFVFCWTERNL